MVRNARTNNTIERTPPVCCLVWLASLAIDSTTHTIDLSLASLRTQSKETVMSNKKFINLCNANNTAWFELYFDLIFVAFILVLGESAQHS